jgi:uncharacterized protein
MIVDFHTHCFADSLAKSAVSTLEQCGRITAVHEGTAGSLKQFMRLCGVDRSVVLPVATKPSQVRAINRWAKDNTCDTLCFFGAVHPEDEAFYDNLQRLKQDGFPGVKLHPDYQHFFADEPRMMPLYEAIRDMGLILVLHAGIDIGCPYPVRCTPLMIRRLLDTVPGLPLVAAHMGGHALWRDVEDVLLGRDLFLDTSYSQYLLERSGVERMIGKHGADRVLFGSDSPWTRADEEIKQIRSLDLPASDIDRILGGNAIDLLSRKPR